MTAAKTVANIILDDDGDNELTIYTERCEKIYAKVFTKLTPPELSGSDPNDTIIVDLKMIETRFTVRGTIASTDESKIDNLMKAGGVFKMTWKDEDYNVNFEKLVITDDHKSENDETTIMFTAIVGEDWS